MAFLILSVAIVGRFTLSSRAEDVAADSKKDSFEFEGTVLDPAGRPLPGARVYFAYNYNSELTPKGQPMPVRATSDAAGHFSFTLKKSDYDAWRVAYPRGICNDVDYKNDSQLVVIADGFGPIWRPAFIFDKDGRFAALRPPDGPLFSRRAG